jgi:hypothetical protein
MSQRPLDLRRSLQAVRLWRTVVGFSPSGHTAVPLSLSLSF